MSAYQVDNARPATLRERRRRAIRRRAGQCVDCRAAVASINPATGRAFSCCDPCRCRHRDQARKWRAS